MQVSPSGMAAASQAVPGEFDSRHLLQKQSTLRGCFCFWKNKCVMTRVEGGAVLREQNALPYEAWIMKISTAKAAIENCRAGRAAKGATLVTCSKKRNALPRAFFFLDD